MLRRVCAQLCAHGVERVTLEVAVDNDRALALYTSIGFVPTVTEDYWSLPAGTRPPVPPDGPVGRSKRGRRAGQGAGRSS